MNNPSTQPRILIVDDNAAIHADFRKILAERPGAQSNLDEVERALFGGGDSRTHTTFRLESAYQGQEALDMVERAIRENDPYVLAFVDVRMPPGWDGVETLEHLWKVSPDLQAVICTAYSDYSWDDITKRLPQADNLLILKKPFDTIEALQMAHALSQKWSLARQARLRMEDLDRMVQERTKKLEDEAEHRLKLETQLRQSQKMEAVGCLAAGIAHEFNNLLTVIQGHAGLLRTPGIDASCASESAERITQASQRAASLTGRLLSFSRKQPVQLKPLNMSTSLQGFQRMLARLLGEPYRLELDCAPGLPCTLADEGNLEQVLINLTLNARDSMPDGGTIRVSTAAVDVDETVTRSNIEARPGKFIRLCVSDTGCGMTPEVMTRIFDPFYTTKEIGKGTGLGLSTVHGIVKQHKGWIEVESQPSRGSTFKIFLPVLNQKAGELDQRERGTPADLNSGSGEVVLLVEDEPSVRDMARLALEQAGYRVLEAADGREALAVWERSSARIDLLLTDMVMPNGLSGNGLCKALKAKDPQLRTLYTTGYSSEAVREGLALKRGVNFIPKPYDATTLLNAVTACLSLEPHPASVSRESGKPALVTS
jgi:signal transduction histidine kinase